MCFFMYYLCFFFNFCYPVFCNVHVLVLIYMYCIVLWMFMYFVFVTLPPGISPIAVNNKYLYKMINKRLDVQDAQIAQ
jgi:uncharacterized membrane-anchored protein